MLQNLMKKLFSFVKFNENKIYIRNSNNNNSNI